MALATPLWAIADANTRTAALGRGDAGSQFV
jgi:hypothetical protein